VEIHLAITAHGHGLGLIVDFNDVLDSCASLSSVDQTDVGSNQHKTRSTRYWEKNTQRLRKNTRGEKKIRGAKKKYASTKTKIRVQIILVQMEQHNAFIAAEIKNETEVSIRNWGARQLRFWKQRLGFRARAPYSLQLSNGEVVRYTVNPLAGQGHK
jgi:hypothetical protein